MVVKLHLTRPGGVRTGRFALPLGPPKQRSRNSHPSHASRGKRKSLTGRYLPSRAIRKSLVITPAGHLTLPWPSFAKRSISNASLPKCLESVSGLSLATTSTPSSFSWELGAHVRAAVGSVAQKLFR
jgi:hypothetical protein